MTMNELFTLYDAQCIPELMPRSQRDYRGILVGRQSRATDTLTMLSLRRSAPSHAHKFRG